MYYPVLFLCLVVFIGILIIKLTIKKYSITVEDFKRLFAELNEDSLIEVTAQDPFGKLETYKTYPIETIRCFDNKKNFVDLKITPAIEIIFTDKANKKTIFYFDLIRLNQNFVTGSFSRFIPSLKKTIDLNLVETIKLQNSRRKYKYIKRKIKYL